MNFEDPILKKDGTIVTWIDVKLLKLAKLLAAPFREEEEETYTPALRRMFKFCGFYFIGVGVLLTVLGSLKTGPSLSAFGALYPSAVLGAFFIALSGWKRVVCTGTGTVGEKQSDKVGALFSLVIPPPIFGVMMWGAGIQAGMPKAFECALGFTLGMALVVMIFGYVRRLGNTPPKRKKAKAFRPAFLPH